MQEVSQKVAENEKVQQSVEWAKRPTVGTLGASILEDSPATLQESLGDRRKRARTEGPRSCQGRSRKH